VGLLSCLLTVSAAEAALAAASAPAPSTSAAESPALLARRLGRLEMRVKLLEEEARGGIDLSKFDPKNFQPPPGE
jgi:hypothetical protein